MVLKKVTDGKISMEARSNSSGLLTLPRDIAPDSVGIEGILVGVEATERRIVGCG